MAAEYYTVSDVDNTPDDVLQGILDMEPRTLFLEFVCNDRDGEMEDRVVVQVRPGSPEDWGSGCRIEMAPRPGHLGEFRIYYDDSVAPHNNAGAAFEFECFHICENQHICPGTGRGPSYTVADWIRMFRGTFSSPDDLVEPGLGIRLEGDLTRNFRFTNDGRGQRDFIMQCFVRLFGFGAITWHGFRVATPKDTQVVEISQHLDLHDIIGKSYRFKYDATTSLVSGVEEHPRSIRRGVFGDASVRRVETLKLEQSVQYVNIPYEQSVTDAGV